MSAPAYCLTRAAGWRRACGGRAGAAPAAIDVRSAVVPAAEARACTPIASAKRSGHNYVQFSLPDPLGTCQQGELYVVLACGRRDAAATRLGEPVRVDAAEALRVLGGVADAATLNQLSSRRKVRTALAAGLIVQDVRGQYALPTAQEAVRAAARLGGVVSHLSAAAYWGWKVKHRDQRPTVTVPRGRKLDAERRAGVTVHFAALTDEERQAGVTGKARTVIDCARVLPFDEALAVADSALRGADVTKAELLRLAEQVRTKGRSRCLRVARVADGRAANPFESVLRAIALDVPGLAVEPQLLITDGSFRARPDLVDRVRRIVIEAESHEFHSDRAGLVRDCERYNDLGLRGWTVYRFTWGHVMKAPWYVTQVLTAAAERAVGVRAS